MFEQSHDGQEAYIDQARADKECLVSHLRRSAPVLLLQHQVKKCTNAAITILELMEGASRLKVPKALPMLMSHFSRIIMQFGHRMMSHLSRLLVPAGGGPFSYSSHVAAGS